MHKIPCVDNSCIKFSKFYIVGFFNKKVVIANFVYIFIGRRDFYASNA